jgi:hypothetical protein
MVRIVEISHCEIDVSLFSASGILQCDSSISAKPSWIRNFACIQAGYLAQWWHACIRAMI